MPHAWHRPHPQAWRRTLIVLAYLLVLPGCGGAPPLPVLLRMPALQLAPVGTPPVSDGRSRFREIFCEVFAYTYGQEERARCQEHLWQLADEPSVEASSPVPQHAPHLHLVIVPGAFEECISATARPYRVGSERLRALGYRVDAVPVSGRSGSDHNARLIAEALSGMPAVEGERLILVGFSKGVVDILHFLVNYPAQALRVSGVLSVAGAVNGSPLADMAAPSYALSAAYVPLPQCATGDRRVLEDLRPAVRLRWLATHRLPAHIKYFSLVAFTERSRMARALSLPAGLLESRPQRRSGPGLRCHHPGQYPARLCERRPLGRGHCH